MADNLADNLADIKAMYANVDINSMKIAVIIPSFCRGGAERTASNLSLILQEKHDVTVILLDSRDQCYPHGGKLIDLGTPPSHSAMGKILTVLVRAYRLKKVFSTEKYDGVIALMEAAGIPAVLASKDTIVSVRDTPESMPSMYQKLIKTVYPRSKKVVAVAKATEKKLQDEYGLNNTTTIYNMANTEMMDKLSASTIDIESSYILAAGRLAPQKGFDLLIEAYASTRAKDHIKLLILGEGSERAFLEALIKEKHLEGRVILYGSTDNPFAFYTKADCFVLSSRHEGFPNILIEALACECACIAVDCPTGPNEIIIDGENGLLIEAENVPKLTETIDRLYYDENMKTKFRKNARPSVSHLSPDSIAQEWVNLM